MKIPIKVNVGEHIEKYIWRALYLIQSKKYKLSLDPTFVLNHNGKTLLITVEDGEYQDTFDSIMKQYNCYNTKQIETTLYNGIKFKDWKEAFQFIKKEAKEQLDAASCETVVTTKKGTFEGDFKFYFHCYDNKWILIELTGEVANQELYNQIVEARDNLDTSRLKQLFNDKS